jgi:hypothetical protein
VKNLFLHHKTKSFPLQRIRLQILHIIHSVDPYGTIYFGSDSIKFLIIIKRLPRLIGFDVIHKF